MILGQCILYAIALIQFYDAVIIISQIDRIVCSDIVVQRKDQIIFHVHLGGIGMHPEYIRHLSA